MPWPSCTSIHVATAVPERGHSGPLSPPGQGQVEKAVGRFRKAVKNAPRDLSALSSLAVAYHESGNFKQALIWYKKVQQLSTPAAIETVQHILAAATVSEWRARRVHMAGVMSAAEGATPSDLSVDVCAAAQ